MPRHPKQITKSADSKDLFKALSTAKVGVFQPQAVSAADLLAFLAEERKRIPVAALTEVLTACAKVFVDAGMGAEGLALHNAMVSILDAVDRRDGTFFRDLAERVETAGGHVDPVRSAIIQLAMQSCEIGEHPLRDTLSRLPIPDVLDFLKRKGLRADPRTVRRIVQELSGKKRKPGRPNIIGQ